MPFTTSSAPPDVRRRFSGSCLETWVSVFNDTLERHGDEGRAFATAETAGQNCKEAKSVDLAVKFVGKDTIAGLALPYGGPFDGKDLDGETFGPDTDLCIDWFGDSGRPVLYDHGLDAAMKTVVVGKQQSYLVQDEGVWAESQLRKNAQYRRTIDELIERGALSYSSGAMPHLVTVKSDGYITRWPWVELSLTPTPANPLAQVYAVKTASVLEHGLTIPSPVAAALKALDDWADTRDTPDSGSESFDDHGTRVVTEVRRFIDRAQKRTEVRRDKVGRVLSAANRERLASLIDALGPALADLKTLLDETDPESKAVHPAVLDAYRTLARLRGLPV